MDDAGLVTDPTDWQGTAVTSLQPVESSLRCQVCKEFFDTPVITSCAHTFCSLCIRRCLSNDGRCPSCRAEDQPLRLRRNWVVEEVVNAFKSARPEILQLGKEVLDLRQSNINPSLKRKLADVSIGDDADEVPKTRRTTRSQNRRAAVSRSPSVYEVSDTAGDEDEQEKPAEQDGPGSVKCPMCDAHMKEEEVWLHIDRIHNAGPTKAPSAMLGLQKEVRTSSNRTETKAPERLSALSYRLMNETALRKKLQSLGVPSHGSKQAMEKRHQEWLNIWNANCDSSKPRSKRDLLRDLDTWERTQGSQARSATDSHNILSKDFDGKAWAQDNGASFKELIAKAKERRSKPESADNGTESRTPDKGPETQSQALMENGVESFNVLAQVP